MTMRYMNMNRTVCEVLREINDFHQKDTKHDRRIRALLREAQDMAKRMSHKLYEYNKEYDKEWWEKNKDYEKDLQLRLKKDYLIDEPEPEVKPADNGWTK
jgi:hypothetical protein